MFWFSLEIKPSMRILRIMKGSLEVLALLIILSGCGLEEIGRRPEGSRNDIWTGPGMNVGKEDVEKTITYVTAVDYPDGYDWRSDCEKGSVKCSLVVYADGLPMMKIPVGDTYEISSDPDMHRVADGHLYTDYCTDTETVIKKDGRLLFRYQGREMIIGMLVRDGDVYTLGQSRDGEGFSYRKNGEILLQRLNGYAFDRLYHDRDSICFSFCEPIHSNDKIIERYYHVVNGKASQTAVREDVRKVWDILSVGGKVCYVASVVGVDSPVLFSDDSMLALDMHSPVEMLTCRIFCVGEDLWVEGLFAGVGLPMTGGVWHGSEIHHIFNPGNTISSICEADGDICCVFNSIMSTGRGKIYRCGEIFEIPEPYFSIGNGTVKMVDGILNVGLSSSTGGKPVIWKDAVLDTLDVHGFIATVSSGRKKDYTSQERVLD